MSYKILYGSDFHGNQILFNKFLSKAKKEDCKAIIYGGDIGPRAAAGLINSVEMQKEFLISLINKFSGFLMANSDCKIFIIMGNDDLRINQYILEKAESQGALYLINKKATNLIDNFNIIGYSFVPITPFKLKDWEKFDDKTKTLPLNALPIEEGVTSVKINEENTTIEEDLEEIKDLSILKNTILLTHCPPYNTSLDVLHNGIHIGSNSIRRFIYENQPLLTLHGHIHESPIVSGKYIDHIGETICVNPGSSFVNFRRVNSTKVLLFDLFKLNKLYIIDL